MSEFVPGETVSVSVTAQPGAFTGEHLVTVDTLAGPVSGFVRDRDFVTAGRTIHAVVRNSTTASLSVVLSGSYFTTNGIAELPADWATKNVKAVA